MAPTRIESREVEVDGELTIELLADGVVAAELRWIELPPSARVEPGWTLHWRLPRTRRAAASDAPPGAPAPMAAPADAAPATWMWPPDEERELAHLVDALRDHARDRTARNEMRVHFWERRARDASAVGAAAWGRERLAAAALTG
jgi:hypothetical protein